MYDLSLTPEQIEFRDTVREFVRDELKPAAIDPKRLEPFEKPLLTDALDKASKLGLRALTLAEESGGAGADALTTCIVLEELGAGDPDVASVIGRTATLAGTLFDRLMTKEQRTRFLPRFMEDDRCHLAFAGCDPATEAGWHYHRPMSDAGGGLVATRHSEGWTIDGELPFVANGTVAGLFVVEARTDAKKTGANGMSCFLVPAGTAGLVVREPLQAIGETIRWHHGAGAGIAVQGCLVPADQRLGRPDSSPFANGAEHARAATAVAAVNLGVARAAFEAAVEYAGIRRQGGRHIIEHQAIGSKLADCAIRLELARNIIWKAAWTLDRGQDAAGGSALPLHVIARVYTAEAANEVALLAAECFGAMGVMRDMPLQKYVHDTMVFLHSADADEAAKLAVAEAVAGYQRPLAA